VLPEATQLFGLREIVEVDPTGLVHAPTGPGLGVAIDFGRIVRLQVAALA